MASDMMGPRAVAAPRIGLTLPGSRRDDKSSSDCPIDGAIGRRRFRSEAGLGRLREWRSPTTAAGTDSASISGLFNGLRGGKFSLARPLPPKIVGSYSIE